MEKLIKIIILNTLLVLMAVAISACTLKSAGAGSGVITIKIQYKLGDVPSENWSNIQVILSGPEIKTLTTGSNGKILTTVDQGNYTLEASKSGYDVVTSNVNGSVEGTTYDLGVEVLQSTTPPPKPY